MNRRIWWRRTSGGILISCSRIWVGMGRGLHVEMQSSSSFSNVFIIVICGCMFIYPFFLSAWEQKTERSLLEMWFEVYFFYFCIFFCLFQTICPGITVRSILRSFLWTLFYIQLFHGAPGPRRPPVYPGVWMQWLQEVIGMGWLECRYTCMTPDRLSIFSLFEFPISKEPQVDSPVLSHVDRSSV